MKRLLALSTLLLPISLFSQGFGSFSHDQPFFAADSSGPTFPGVQPALAYWWHAADISSNNPVTVWYDKIAGFQLVQSNTVYQPTNSSKGVCFDGTKSMEFKTTLKIPTNSSFFISGYFSQMPHSQAIVYSTNFTEGLLLSPTNQLVVRYGSANYDFTSVGNNTNLVDLEYTTEKSTSNIKVVAYLNGSQTSSNFLSGNGSSLDLVGGLSDKCNSDPGWLDLSLYAYITDIMVWTNITLVADNMTWLHNWNVYTNSPNQSPFFNPASIAGMFEWFRADQPQIGYTSGGGGHTNRMPASYAPESYNLADTSTLKFSASPAPIWVSSVGTASRPAIINYTNAFLFRDNASTTYSQPTIWFAVVQNTNSLSGNQGLFDGNNGSRQINYINVMTMFAGSSDNFPAPTSVASAATVVTTCFNGANSWVRTNGVLAGTGSGTAGTGAFKQGLILGNDTAFTAPFKGYYHELMAYTGALSTNDVQAIENNLKSKYNIP